MNEAVSSRAGEPSRAYLDFNENPLGPSPQAIAAVASAARDLHRYPRDAASRVSELLARFYGVSLDRILLVNGVDEAIDLALGLVDSAWTVRPGFDAYSHRAEVLGKKVRRIVLDDRFEPSCDPEELASGGVVFLAQPHNPTGNFFSPSWMDAAAASAELVFLDETYIEFSDRDSLMPSVSDDNNANLLIFRSFSKVYGLAGIRLGVLVGSPRRIASLRERQRFHSVDSVALHAAEGTLSDLEHIARSQAHVAAMRPQYRACVANSRLFEDAPPTQASFVIGKCREGLDGGRLTAALRDLGVEVKDCAPMGMPDWIRFSIGTEQDLSLLEWALAAATVQFDASVGSSR
ncbi:pyridoxal phosphate-dependent aminotransferase [Streptomyces sp. NPDC059534]|uniref:pyridoxal phosphate-dependent aminotransferase n=1 Tax=Streptomyces sp. NPDC059534 TaxID=3346859 RepID=UPI0036A9EF69